MIRSMAAGPPRRRLAFGGLSRIARKEMFGNGASMYSANCPARFRSRSAMSGAKPVIRPTPMRITMAHCHRRIPTFNPGGRFSYFMIPPPQTKGIQTLGRIFAFDSYSNQHYQGLQTTLQRRYSHGFTFGLAYTYSKANGDGEDGGNEAAMRQVANDRARPSARTAFEYTHNAAIYFVS